MNVQSFALGVFCLLGLGYTELPAQVKLSLEQVSVLDSVNYEPNLPTGGFAEPQSRQRYTQNTLSLENQFDSENSFKASLSNYEIASLRDFASIQQIEFALRKQILSKRGGHFIYSIGAKHSFTSSFEKNSFTTTSEGIVTSASIQNPKDMSLFISTGYSGSVFENTSAFSLFTLGYQASSFTNLQGQGVSNSGCRFNFSAAPQDGGELTQTEPCGIVNSYQQSYPNDALLNERLGISPSTDIEYSGWYIGSDLGLSKAIGSRFTVSTDYKFRYFLRNSIDDNLEAFDHTPVTMSHSVSLQIQTQITTKLTMSLRANYQVAPFLENIPFLYTRYTSSRFQNSAPSFAVLLNYYL